jgi:hypothetical protein
MFTIFLSFKKPFSPGVRLQDEIEGNALSGFSIGVL